MEGTTSVRRNQGLPSVRLAQVRRPTDCAASALRGRTPTAFAVKETIMPPWAFRSGHAVWRNLLPTDAPGCAHGAPYSFWVRQADPHKLALILSGGGACWSGETCAPGERRYRATAGLERDPTDLG